MCIVLHLHFTCISASLMRLFEARKCTSFCLENMVGISCTGKHTHTHTGACERSGKAHVTLLLQFRLTNGNWSGNIFCPHCMAAVPTEQIDQMRWANSAKWIGTCAALASMSMCGLLPFESNYSHVLFAQRELYFFVQGTGLDRQQSITIHDAMIICSRVHLVFVCHNFSLLLLLSKSISVEVAIAIHPGHINSMLQLRSAHRTLHILRSPPNNKPFWLFDITIVHKCRLNWIVMDRKTLCAEISVVELSAPANERNNSNNKKEKSDNKQFRQKEYNILRCSSAVWLCMRTDPASCTMMFRLEWRRSPNSNSSAHCTWIPFFNFASAAAADAAVAYLLLHYTVTVTASCVCVCHRWRYVHL